MRPAASRRARGQLGVQRRRALGREPRGVAGADRGVGRRPQVQLGQRGAQVEAGAADDDRAPARGEQPVDLGVGAAGVVAGGGGRGDRQDPEQPVLEPRAVGGARRAGEDLQARVELQRVGRHRDGILPVRTQRARRARSRPRSSPRPWGRTARRRAGPARRAGSHGGRRPRPGMVSRTWAYASAAGSRRSRTRATARPRPPPRRATRSAAATATSRWCSSRAGISRRPRRRSRRCTRRSRRPSSSGCGAGGVIGEMREVEEGTAVSVWAAALDGGAATPVPRRGRGARRRRRRAQRDAGPERRRRRAPALRSVHVPDRRGAARALRGGADAAAPGRARLRPLARRRHAAAARRRGRHLRRGRRALRRRRDPALRVPGRRADRARADHHRLRGADHRRAGRAAGAREAARDDRVAQRRGPAARPGRAADGHRHRREQARLRAGRLPRPRARRRRSRTRARSPSAPTCGRARSCGCTRATPRARTATCATRSARGCSRSAAACRRARS